VFVIHVYLPVCFVCTEDFALESAFISTILQFPKLEGTWTLKT